MSKTSIRQSVKRVISTHQTGWGRSQGKMTLWLELACGHQLCRPESRPVKGKIECPECSLAAMKVELARQRFIAEGI